MQYYSVEYSDFCITEEVPGMKLELKIIGLNATTAVKRYYSPTGEISLTYLDAGIMKLWLEEQCSILQTTKKEKLNDKIVIVDLLPIP